MDHERASTRRDRVADALVVIGAMAVAAVAVMRCVTGFEIDPVFGTDPVIDFGPRAGLGPVGSLALDVLLLVACTTALAGEAASRRGLDWRLFLLAVVPVPVVFLAHGSVNFQSLWRESTWVAAAAACVTLAHVARVSHVRIVIIAMLAAVVAPLILRGVSQVYLEHPEMVKLYRSDPARFLTSQGIEPGTAGAMVFERRLMQPEASGWFGLANVFGSFMVFGAVMWLGALVGCARAKVSGGWIGISILAFGACVGGLYYAGSKGAFAAAAVGAGLIVLSALAPRRGAIMSILNRRGGWIGIALIGLALGAVLARGVLLPEGFMSEKSVLFRWHYLLGTVPVIAEHVLRGVGADGFQAAYVLHRLPVAPEEISSAHSIFFDWLAVLGVSGIAWIVLVGVQVSRGMREVHPGQPTSAGPSSHAEAAESHRVMYSPANRFAGLMIVGVLIAGLLPAFYLEQSTLDMASIVLRAAGVLAFAGVAFASLRILRAMDQRWLHWIIASAVLALVVHAQIELTVTHPGAVVWCFAMLGVVAPAGPRARGKLDSLWPILVLALAACIGFAWLAPAAAQKRRIEEAAAPLRAIGELRSTAENADAATRPGEASAREEAARQLMDAYVIMPSNVQPIVTAADQYIIAAQLDPDSPLSRSRLERAAELAQQAYEQHTGPRSLSRLGNAWEGLARMTDDREAWDRAISARRTLVELDPNGLRTTMLLADVLYDSPRRSESAAVYRRALVISDNWYLDELKQLQLRDADRVRRRLESLSEGRP